MNKTVLGVGAVLAVGYAYAQYAKGKGESAAWNGLVIVPLAGTLAFNAVTHKGLIASFGYATATLFVGTRLLAVAGLR